MQAVYFQTLSLENCNFPWRFTGEGRYGPFAAPTPSLPVAAGALRLVAKRKEHLHGQ